MALSSHLASHIRTTFLDVLLDDADESGAEDDDAVVLLGL
jgi:hypothetical protein